MKNNNLKWAVLFFFLILFPAAVLTYLSVQTLRDEQRSALADLNLLVPRLQNALDQVVGQMVQSSDVIWARAQVVLDANGVFIKPHVVPLVFKTRRDTFQSLLTVGETAEFQDGDLGVAHVAYLDVLSQAETEDERAEVLNALGRVAFRQGRFSNALQYWRQLRDMPQAMDADGAHPLTLTVLRFAQETSFNQALPVVHDWVNGILDGRYPMYRGVSYSVRVLERWANRSAHRYDDARRVAKQLDDMAQWASLIDVWPQLRSAGLGDLGYVFRSGTNEQGETVLMLLKPQADQTVQGVVVDVQALADTLRRTAVGKEIDQNGFAWTVFDVDAAQTFKTNHQDVMHLVTPASTTLYRLNFGFYTRGDLQVFQIYRARNTWVLMGVFALAGLIGVGAFLIYRDITREIVVAKLRADFVSNVSHELRTPLTSIRMYAETLFMKRYHSEDQVQTYLETIMQESQRLSRMVGNILDFSRIEDGRKKYAFESCDPQKVVQTVVDEFDPILNEKGFVLNLDIEPDLPVVNGDRDALETALANLLSNAVKYSRERKAIRVSIWVQDSFLVFEVADRGVGVPTQEQKTIFEKFYRASNAHDLATGTGLGLALVKGVMDAHKGSVTYESREGGGSVFRLLLPLTH